MSLSDTAIRLTDLVLEENPTHAQFLAESVAGIEAAEAAELDAYLQYMLRGGHSVEYLAECYNTIVLDTLREQVHFRRKGRYRHSSYEEVADAVYHNPDYMERYMVGLAITLFLWPAHRELKRFFYASLPTDRTGTYFEVGPGHGFFLIAAMRRGSFGRYVAVDISAKSVELTKDVVSSGAFGNFREYDIVQADFLNSDIDGAPFDAVTMGEVLEHVERPVDFLSRIRAITSPRSHIYVSTCINAPAIDHISLFRSVDELHELVDAGGLRVIEERVVPYAGLTLEETVEQRLPLNIGMVLGHA